MKYEDAINSIYLKQIKKKFGRCYDCEHRIGEDSFCRVRNEYMFKNIEPFTIMFCKYKERSSERG